MKPSCFFIGTTLADNPTPRHFMAVARELALRGHRVVILAPHRRVDLVDSAANPAIYTWPSDRPTKPRDGRFLRDLIDTHKPACLIANFVAVNVMMLRGWLARVPVRVAWYHTISSQIALDNPSPAWRLALLRWRKGMVYRAATHVAANSKASALDLQAVYGVPESKCKVFHNSLTDPVEEFALTPELPTPGRLVCVARLFPSKGQDVLLQALAIVRKKIPSAHLELIGEGPAQASLEKLATELGLRDKCLFSGQLPHSEVLKRMGTAVATVVPSRMEAFGLVNIESMALGTPVVASNVGGIPEIVRDGLDGLLVPPGNPEALASALKVLLSDPHLRREMRGNARQRFLSHFELSHAAREQADWFEKTVSKKLIS